jgi:hypothetical protein
MKSSNAITASSANRTRVHLPLAQRAIVMVLESVYEQDFLPCSFGFRPGRSAHQALQFLRTAIMGQGLRWVVDIDIVKYFDSISHSHLRDFLDQRVTDGVIRRMIDKWLKAGVLEDGLLRHATEGSPQGGVISPCLSNIFLALRLHPPGAGGDVHGGDARRRSSHSCRRPAVGGSGLAARDGATRGGNLPEDQARSGPRLAQTASGPATWRRTPARDSKLRLPDIRSR